MITTDMRPIERAGRLAKMLLEELVSDKPLYSVGIDALTHQFKDACAEAGVDPRIMLTSASHDLCAVQQGFESRLRQRASAVNSLPLH
jgi:hypothetical protein